MTKKILALALGIILLDICGCAFKIPGRGMPHVNRTVSGAAGGAAAGAAAGLLMPVSIPVAAAVGGLTGGLLGYDLDQHQTPEERGNDWFTQRGGQVVKVGDGLRIIIPSEAIFYPHTARFEMGGHRLMQYVMTYLDEYDTSVIMIRGYTNDNGRDMKNLALSRAQAQEVLKQLRYAGMTDKRLVVAQGMGPTKPLILASTNANNRIEITLDPISEQS